MCPFQFCFFHTFCCVILSHIRKTPFPPPSLHSHYTHCTPSVDFKIYAYFHFILNTTTTKTVITQIYQAFFSVKLSLCTSFCLIFCIQIYQLHPFYKYINRHTFHMHLMCNYYDDIKNYSIPIHFFYHCLSFSVTHYHH